MPVIVLSVVSLLWGVTGLAAVLFPEWVVGTMTKSLANPWQRFWLTQGLLLCGLMLIVGTLMLEGFWLWIGCGVVMVVKACVFLGLSDPVRGRFLQLVNGCPQWSFRAGGVLNLGLAVLLAGDLILHG